MANHKDSIGLFAKYSHNFSFLKSEAGGDDSAAHLLSIIVAFQNRWVVTELTQKCKVLVYCQLPSWNRGQICRASKEEHILHLSCRNWATAKQYKVHLTRIKQKKKISTGYFQQQCTFQLLLI